MARPRITLAGTTCLALGAVGWRFTSGPQPYSQVFLIHDSEWEQFKGNIGKQVTLKIGGYATIEKLWVVQEVPSSKPYYRGVEVADQRWAWQRKIVLRDYNIRRKQNKMRLLGPELIQLQTPIPKYGFAPSSMKAPDEPWTAKTLIEDVGKLLDPDFTEADSLPIVKSGKVSTEDGEDVRGIITINDVRIRNNGNGAMAIALSQVPGATCWIDGKGKLRVFDTTDLGETGAWLDKVGPETTAGGIVREIDRKPIRPKEIHVYFAREIEFLCIAKEEGSQKDRYAKPEGTHAEADLFNVLPCPDPLLELTSGDSVAMGTWINLEEAIDSWEGTWGLDTDLALKDLRKLWMTGALESIYGGAGNLLASDSPLPRRISALRAHWRTTYRIDPLLMDRFERIEATRLAIMDEVTRTRAPSTVWAQYHIQYSNKGMVALTHREDTETVLYQNVDAYPDFEAGGSFSEKEPIASAVVQVLDRELGIVHISWASDPYGLFARIGPGYLVGDDDEENTDVDVKAQAPMRALRFQGKEPVFVGGTVGGAGGITCSAGYRAGMLFTAVPAAPNNKERFERVVVKPSQVTKLMASEFNVQDSDGPIWEVFAPPSLITSRWAIVPSKFDYNKYLANLNQLLGIIPKDEEKGDDDEVDSNAGGGDGAPGTAGGAEDGEGAGDAGGAADKKQEDEGVKEPPEPWGLLNEAHLKSWAIAESMKIWNSLADRHEGTPGLHLSTVRGDDQVLKGSIQSLALEGHGSGRMIASVTLERGGAARLDPMALIPQWARPEILGVVLDRQKP
jgi:hypothetical protein